MIERQRHKLSHSVTVLPGDTLVCRVQDMASKTEHKFTERIGRSFEVDTIVTFDVDEPIFGLSGGIGAIFGKSVDIS